AHADVDYEPTQYIQFVVVHGEAAGQSVGGRGPRVGGDHCYHVVYRIVAAHLIDRGSRTGSRAAYREDVVKDSLAEDGPRHVIHLVVVKRGCLGDPRAGGGVEFAGVQQVAARGI